MLSRRSPIVWFVFSALLTLMAVGALNDHPAYAVLPSGNGQTTAAKSVSVVFASDAAAITANISGGATSAKQDTGNTSLATIATNTTGVATAGNQTTGNGSLATIATNLPAKGTATMSGATPVTLATDDTLGNKLTMPTTSAAVTPSDSTVLACGKGLWVGTAGNVSWKLSGDSSAVTISNVSSGTPLFGNVIRVMAATTATNVVCLN